MQKIRQKIKTKINEKEVTKEVIRYREKIYVDGKEFYSPRFERKSDALNWKLRMLSERTKYLVHGIMPDSLKDKEDREEQKFKTFANTWLETKVKLQLSQRTYEHYENVIRKHLIPILGELSLNKIHLKHGNKLTETLITKGHNAKGINLIIGVLKRILFEAVRLELIIKNPLQHLKQLKSQNSHDVFLSHAEINLILDLSQNDLFYSLFLVAINTGMRRGELAGLCWDKVSFDRNLIEVSRIRDRNGLGDRTKTFKSRRYIPMNAVVRNHLLQLKEQTQAKLVFSYADGSTFDVNHIYRDLKRYLKMAKIETHFRFHDLRHTFASHFMMNGGNIYDLQKILGHTSLEMTGRYAHLAPEHLVLASNIVSFGANMVNRNLSDRANTGPELLRVCE